MATDKQTHLCQGVFLAAASNAGLSAGGALTGYEIHMGETSAGGKDQPLLQLTRCSDRETMVADGAVSDDGRVWGTYLHDIFAVPGVRQGLLDRLRKARGLELLPVRTDDPVDTELERLADHLERHLDLARLLPGHFPAAGEGK